MAVKKQAWRCGSLSYRGLQNTLERGSPPPGPVLVTAMTKHHDQRDLQKESFIGAYWFRG